MPIIFPNFNNTIIFTIQNFHNSITNYQHYRKREKKLNLKNLDVEDERNLSQPKHQN